MLSLHGWNWKVLTHACTLVGTHISHCLRRSDAESTALCTREHMTHHLLGQILSTRDGLTDLEIRSLLQIRGNSYPTAAVVSRNKKGGVCSTCPLCHDGDETISHKLMHCPETEAARHRAHDCIADPLLTSIAQSSETAWQIWLRPVAWRITSLLLTSSHPPLISGGLGSRLSSQYQGDSIPPVAPRIQAIPVSSCDCLLHPRLAPV
eukprot:2019407-Rhodomonas_salina.1